MNTAKVAALGEALAVLVPETPGPLRNTEVFTRTIGGAELNVTFGLASRGIESALLTRVGDDGFGSHIVAEALARGVDVSGVEVDPVRRTGLYIKEVGGSSFEVDDLGPGVSKMHYYRADSASSALSPAYLDRPDVTAILDRSSLVHITGITPALSDSARDTCFAIAERRDDDLVSFDLNWRAALWAGREAEGAETLRLLSRSADVVLVGASEALIAFGTDDPAELRLELPEPRILVVKNDAEQASAFDRSVRYDVPALVVDVVETIGAGDAFAAGFLAALVSGRDVGACLAEAHSLAVRALSSHHDHVSP